MKIKQTESWLEAAKSVSLRGVFFVTAGFFIMVGMRLAEYTIIEPPPQKIMVCIMEDGKEGACKILGAK